MSKKYCKHLNEWREEGKWYQCPLCRMKVMRERGQRDKHICPVLRSKNDEQM